MDATNTKPDAVGASGVSRDRAEPSTAGVYTAAEPITDDDWEAALLPIIGMAGTDSERSVRARRAVHQLCDTPFISPPIHAAAEAVSWTFCAAILSGDADLRRRANALIGQVLSLAAESRESLGRAA